MPQWGKFSVVLAACLGVAGCITKAAPDDVMCTGPTCASNTPTEQPEPLSPTGTTTPATEGALNPLCGTAVSDGMSCVPDNPRDCSGVNPADLLGSGAARDGGTNTFTVTPVTPIVDMPPPMSSVDASVPDVSGEGGADAGVDLDGGVSDAGVSTNPDPKPKPDPKPPSSGGAGAGGSGAGGAENVPAQSPGGELGGMQTEFVAACRIRVEDGAVKRACDLAGSGAAQSPCTSSRDCAPGLGCVGEEHAGRCLPYCCRGQGSCGEASFCTEMPLLTEVPEGQAVPRVPVCAPAEGCNLDEPYPCPESMSCTCGPGTVCTPVNNGLRSCLPPGTGLRGEDCPCAPGYFCAVASQKCEKLCQDDDECGADMCGYSPSIDWGVCVGQESR